MTTITALPAAPARTMDAPTFVTTADTFVAALPPMVTQINAAISEVNDNTTSAVLSAQNAKISQIAAKASEDNAQLYKTTAQSAAAAAQSAVGLPALKAGRLLRTDGSTVSWDVVDGATKYATTDFGAVVGASYDVNTVLGTVTVTTPNNPVADDWFQLTDTGNAGTNNIIVKRGGKNLITFPEDFSNAAWGKTGNLTVTANSATAPDGTLTADTITKNAIGNSYVWQNVSSVVAANNTYTGSFWVKSTNFTGILNAFMKDQSGTIFGTAPVTVSAMWQRVQITATYPPSAAGGVVLYIDKSDTPDNATDNIILWGAKLELGASASFYDPVTASTNLLTYSEQLDHANWVKNSSTIAFGTFVAPDGTATADRMVEAAATAEHFVFQVRTGSNETVTQSLYVKAGERGKVALRFTNFASASIYAVFDVVSGTVVSVGAPNTDYTSPSASMYYAGNGWWRCIFTVTKGTVNTTNDMQVSIVDAANNLSYLGDVTKGIYLWGAQLEAGIVATPYIKTVGASASRTGNPTKIMGIADDLAIRRNYQSCRLRYQDDLMGWVLR